MKYGYVSDTPSLHQSNGFYLGEDRRIYYWPAQKGPGYQISFESALDIALGTEPNLYPSDPDLGNFSKEIKRRKWQGELASLIALVTSAAFIVVVFLLCLTAAEMIGIIKKPARSEYPIEFLLGPLILLTCVPTILARNYWLRRPFPDAANEELAKVAARTIPERRPSSLGAFSANIIGNFVRRQYLRLILKSASYLVIFGGLIAWGTKLVLYNADFSLDLVLGVFLIIFFGSLLWSVAKTILALSTVPKFAPEDLTKALEGIQTRRQ